MFGAWTIGCNYDKVIKLFYFALTITNTLILGLLDKSIKLNTLLWEFLGNGEHEGLCSSLTEFQSG